MCTPSLQRALSLGTMLGLGSVACGQPCPTDYHEGEGGVCLLDGETGSEPDTGGEDTGEQAPAGLEDGDYFVGGVIYWYDSDAGLYWVEEGSLTVDGEELRGHPQWLYQQGGGTSCQVDWELSADAKDAKRDEFDDATANEGATTAVFDGVLDIQGSNDCGDLYDADIQVQVGIIHAEAAQQWLRASGASPDDMESWSEVWEDYAESFSEGMDYEPTGFIAAWYWEAADEYRPYGIIFGER